MKRLLDAARRRRVQPAAIERVRVARKIYGMYQGDKTDDPEARRTLPPFVQIQASALVDFLLNGEKLFITNVVPGRTIGVVCLILSVFGHGRLLGGLHRALTHFDALGVVSHCPFPIAPSAPTAPSVTAAPDTPAALAATCAARRSRSAR